MGSNSFGHHFSWTTWGESHGAAIGVVIDGCPAGLEITEEEINEALSMRAPGNSPYTSPRKEPDRVEILSGVFEGKTTGTPISLMIANCDADPGKYESIKHLERPGHANAAYLAKYGVFDWRGGGRASARETACRVAAGAVAKKLLGEVKITARLLRSEEEIKEAMEAGDSIGGVVEAIAVGLPKGLGEPLYRKLEAELAYAMLSIPASKGFEVDSGFAAADMRGSRHNQVSCGVSGGISTGADLKIRVAFKPTSSISIPQETHDLDGEKALFRLPKGSRHDPCVAVRAVPVVEAMFALVLADAVLHQNAHASYIQLQ